jgi:hypothetical protein
LTAQAPFDLDHEPFRQPQGIEGLVEGVGGVLCLAAVSRVWWESWSTPGFYRGLWRLQSAQASVTHTPCVCEHDAASASRAPRTSYFLLPTLCGINASEWPFPFLHRLLHAASA